MKVSTGRSIAQSMARPHPPKGDPIVHSWRSDSGVGGHVGGGAGELRRTEPYAVL
jgi:hypothetical protein